jgi:hypothetical protein
MMLEDNIYIVLLIARYIQGCVYKAGNRAKAVTFSIGLCTCKSNRSAATEPGLWYLFLPTYSDSRF